MNRINPNFYKPFSVAGLLITAAVLILAACSTTVPEPDSVSDARGRLSRLQADAQLASHVQVEIDEAERAVRAAEEPQEDPQIANHLALMADRKVDIAVARAQSRQLVDLREQLSEQRDNMRLEARTKEVDRARKDAASVRSDLADARKDSAAAEQKSADLQRQIAGLNAKATDRGLVMTLGDLLFATADADLNDAAFSNLGKLAAFLKQYPDRTVAIEGHTDSIGSDDANLGLSQRRADSVRRYLIGQGINADRLSAYGKGEDFPIASNDSSVGRQQNRRVEVVISNTVAESSN